MAATEPAILPLTRDGERSVTANGEIGCVMSDKAITVKTPDSFKFRYRTRYDSGISEIEWPNDTMFVVIPAEFAEYLLRENYARLMTAVEADAYNMYIRGEKS
jgi:hypothetical protein